MNLWRDLPERLAAPWPVWKIILLVFLSLDVALSSILPDSILNQSFIPVVGTMVVIILCLFTFSKDFVVRLSSGRRQLHIQRNGVSNVPNWALHIYRWYYPFTRYVVGFVICFTLISTFSMLIDMLMPSFSSDQNIGIPSGNTWAALGTGLLGCTEEYWRWAMIVVSLLVAKGVWLRGWREHTWYRRFAFVSALLMSSFVFGMAHYQEFSQYKSWSYVILGTMGLLLALSAIITRRFLVAVALHFTYDFLAMSDWSSDITMVLYAALLVSLFVFVPLYFWLYRQVRPAIVLAGESSDHP